MPGILSCEIAKLEPGDRPELWLNSGGPMSRTRTENIRSSVLGADRSIRCPRVIQVGLDFGKKDPASVVFAALAKAGILDPGALRHLYSAPPRPCICQNDPYRAVPLAHDVPPSELLTNALILGLSTAFLYDPSRPVLITRASLTRRLELFQPEGFYA